MVQGIFLLVSCTKVVCGLEQGVLESPGCSDMVVIQNENTSTTMLQSMKASKYSSVLMDS